MRSILAVLTITFFISCNTTKNASGKMDKMNGSWIPVKEEIGGTSLPPAAFGKQKLIINDSNYMFTAESVDKGVIRYKDDKMDIYGREGVNTGRHFTAIYKFENEQLTICYNLSGNVYPEVFDTKGKPLYFLASFKREGK
jgi:uncharacterized protein (TIGR03067 family)